MLVGKGYEFIGQRVGPLHMPHADAFGQKLPPILLFGAEDRVAWNAQRGVLTSLVYLRLRALQRTKINNRLIVAYLGWGYL